MASIQPRRAAEFDIGKKTSSFTSKISSGLAGLGKFVGQGIAGLGTATARAGARTGTVLAGLGTSSGGKTPQQFTKIIPGNPQTQPQQQFGRRTSLGELGGRRSPYLPDSGRGDEDSFSGRGIGGTGFTMDAWRARGDAWREQNRLRLANEENVSAYNKAFAEAKEGNESRYQQLLEIADKTTGQRAKDIGIDYAGRESNAMQQLARLGMANTTVAPTLGQGFAREKSSALDRLSDQMQQTKLGIIERRKDAYPDLTSLTSLGQLGISGLKF